MARITSVHLASIKHSKNPFGVNLKQASHINLWNHIALLYVMPSNTHPTCPTIITPDSKATSPSPASSNLLAMNPITQNFSWCFCRISKLFE